MLLHRTATGLVARRDDTWRRLDGRDWDDVFRGDDAVGRLERWFDAGADVGPPEPASLLAPVGSQEIWAAGVTYTRSLDARKGESEEAGGSSFYDRVYRAERPELFFKATPHRAVGPGGVLRLRPDSSWMVPEPELTLAVTDRGEIFGYTVGNDLSCRDIEGENPLYLPQAKVFDGCVGLGPALAVRREPLPPSTAIRLVIRRGGRPAFEGEVTLERLARSVADLVAWLYRASSFPAGCLLLTGTGIVPPDDFTLEAGDEVEIAIDHVGVLTNRVEALG